jgi:hypothetical protein
MNFKLKKLPWWVGIVLAGIVVVVLFGMKGGGAVQPLTGCPSNQYYCPGVGCLSGPDKCVSGNTGGASAVFSKEGFTSQCSSMKNCRGGTRTDGPCLMEFPGYNA